MLEGVHVGAASVDWYERNTSAEQIARLRALAAPLRGVRVLHLNATPYGGGVAEILGKKLKQVAASHQVICVTHLPQIAALADSHYIVEKEIVKGRTFAQVRRLGDKDRVDEVARMLGGVKITDKTRRHAEEMVRGK